MKYIAEIGQAHEGSLGIAHSYIDALSKTGIDIIKWQTHIAEAESSIYEPFRVKFSYEDNSRFEYWKRMEFTKNQWKELKSHCDDLGIIFMSSPFSLKAVDLLEDIGVESYKIGSGEVSNLLILEKIARTKKPIYLSSGMSSYVELDETINFLKNSGNELSILQCTTSYPTKPEQWGLNVIEELKSRYQIPVGFSDHSGDIFACLGATSLGADILEFHVVFDKMMFGPDTSSSIPISNVKTLLDGANQIKTAIENPLDKNDISNQMELKGIFEKSIAVNKDLEAGSKISFEDLEAKKPPNKGISAKLFKNVIGKRLKKKLLKWQFLTINDIEEDG